MKVAKDRRERGMRIREDSIYTHNLSFLRKKKEVMQGH